MRTLPIGQVHDEGAERLTKLARCADLPLSSFALQEQNGTGLRADRAELLAWLRFSAVKPASMLEALQKLRSDR